jgi:hypothetical protein
MRGILKIRTSSVHAVLLAALAAGLFVPGAQAQSATPNQKSDKQASGSSQAQALSKSSNATEEESVPANKEHAGGPHEGIKIHGHWVIDVRNPKGEFVEHREFENSYVGHLPAILAGQVSVGGWEIALVGGTSTYFFVVPVTGVGEVSPLSIGGSWTATSSDTVSLVRSQIDFCDASVSPAACSSLRSSGESFSVATLPVPVPFVQGQVVQVSVTFTFS